MYTQYIRECDQHDNCTAIICKDNQGNTAWTSHDNNTINAIERLNPAVGYVDER